MQFSVADTITGIHTPADIIARLLAGRGIGKKQQESFLHPIDPLSNVQASDFGIDEKALKKVLSRLAQAKQKKEQVVIYGDYDVDGITSTAILWRALRSYGVLVMPYIPQRSQGYGFSKEGIATVMERHKPSLILAVDHGITARELVDELVGKGVEVILCDHHEVDAARVPRKASAILHTTEVSAAGISFLLSAALRDEAQEEDMVFAGIASLADVIAQRGMARALAYHALRRLPKSSHPGIRALMAQAGIDTKTQFTSTDVGYILAPRINAAGRMGDPIIALRLLCTTNPIHARTYAAQLDTMNRKRQAHLERALSIAEELVQPQLENRALVVASTEFNEGIVGLVAGKLMQKYYLPVFVGAEKDNLIKGSVRSIEGINIVSVLDSTKNLLQSFGGHTKAGGFSLEKKNFTHFANGVREALKYIPEEMFEKTQRIDLSLPLGNVTTSLALALEEMEPYGELHKKPQFISSDVHISHITSVGKRGTHVKMQLHNGSTSSVMTGIYFNAPSDIATYEGTQQSLVYSVDCNRWKTPEAQVVIQHI